MANKVHDYSSKNRKAARATERQKSAAIIAESADSAPRLATHANLQQLISELSVVALGEFEFGDRDLGVLYQSVAMSLSAWELPSAADYEALAEAWELRGDNEPRHDLLLHLAKTLTALGGEDFRG